MFSYVRVLELKNSRMESHGRLEEHLPEITPCVNPRVYTEEEHRDHRNNKASRIRERVALPLNFHDGSDRNGRTFDTMLLLLILFLLCFHHEISTSFACWRFVSLQRSFLLQIYLFCELFPLRFGHQARTFFTLHWGMASVPRR